VLEPIPFLIAGAILGAGLGGVGVTDRLLLMRLAPPDRIGELLGVYGLVGKLSAVIGPVLYTSIVAALLPSLDRGAYQVAIASLLGLLAIGVLFVLGVPEGRPGTDDDDALIATEPAIVPPGETAR
jgi:UMF1 family MFS transporter